MTLFQVNVLQKKVHADFSTIVLKYSNEVHSLRYLTPLDETETFSITQLNSCNKL